MDDLVTVIIPTYNRFDFLLAAIESVNGQTHTNIELIIVNDCSTDHRYYNYHFENAIVIHLDKNSKTRFGHASPGGFQRTMGMKIASGNYIAFLDDDDYWLPTKLEMQLKTMKEHSCNMSCTEAYFGNGQYDVMKKYIIYNDHKYKNTIKSIFAKKQKSHLMEHGFPAIWNQEFMETHNCCIASSVIIHKSIIDKIGYFSNQLWAPDYEYWKRVIKHTDCAYVNAPLVYYDGGHGNGQQY